MKLSVIIPVYRVETTLDRCVSSVIGQNISDMEVILVDDGSPDRCPELCDEWVQKDDRIRVIHKVNGGLSDARNAALDIAKGDYVTFVDSDDWLADNTYALLLENIGDSDIMEYSISERLMLTDRTYTDINDYWLTEKAYTHTYACNKIYRRNLFDNIRFPKGRIFEDAYTFPKLLQQTSVIRTSHLGAYHYSWNPSSITATADGTGLAQLLDAHLTNGMPVDDCYYLHLANIQMDVWERTGAPILLPERQVDTSLFKGHNKLKAVLLNKLGIRLLCRINKLIHYVRKPNR